MLVEPEPFESDPGAPSGEVLLMIRQTCSVRNGGRVVARFEPGVRWVEGRIAEVLCRDRLAFQISVMRHPAHSAGSSGAG